MYMFVKCRKKKEMVGREGASERIMRMMQRSDHVAIKILTAMATHAKLTYGESRSPVQ
jgi:hypothetical protein